MIFLLCTPAGAQNTTSKNDLNIAAIESSLCDFSAALATADTASLRRLTAPSFVLLEEGRTFDCEAMMVSIQQIFAAGVKMKRLPSHFHTEMRGSVAWANYRVIGEFENIPGKIPLALLEAAVLEYDGRRWRLVQMTTIPAADK